MCCDAKIFFEFSGFRNQLLHPFDHAITIAFDQFAMCFGKTTQTWREDYQLTAGLDNTAQLVAGFSAYPKFVVMFVQKGDHSMVFAARVFNVDLAADIRGSPETHPEITNEQSLSTQAVIGFPSDDGRETNDLRRNEVSCSFDQSSGGRFDQPNSILYSGESSQPVGCMG